MFANQGIFLDKPKRESRFFEMLKENKSLKHLKTGIDFDFWSQEQITNFFDATFYLQTLSLNLFIIHSDV